MRVRIKYTSDWNAKEKGLPKQGTIVALNHMVDLFELSKAMGSELIISHDDQKFLAPIMWYKGAEIDGEHDWILPYDPEELPWIEVYNGYRE